MKDIKLAQSLLDTLIDRGDEDMIGCKTKSAQIIVLSSKVNYPALGAIAIIVANDDDNNFAAAMSVLGSFMRLKLEN